MRVGALMATDVKACSPEDSLNRAAQIMWENDCGCVPVADDSGRVVGVVTDRDACMAAYTQGRALGEIPVSSAMSKAVVACGAGDAVADAERRMREQRVRRLVVVEADGRLAGILSLSDIARRARREPAGGRKKAELGLEAVGETLATICEQPHSGEVAAAEAFVAWTGEGTKSTTRRRRPREEPPGARPGAGGKSAAAARKPSARKKRD